MAKNKMPSLFIGHGSPMNIIADNSYTQTLQKLGETLIKPKSILAISAHWMTQKLSYTAGLQPKTIHDFGGFPPALYQVQYPAPGDLVLQNRLQEIFENRVQPAKDWGLDHGTWSVLHHMYPDAKIPVTQLSLTTSLSLTEHYALAEKLQPLRQEGVLILASGNIVHNLREIDFSETEERPAWAEQFDSQVIQNVMARNDRALLEIDKLASKLFHLSHPTTEHYLPLIYALGATKTNEMPKILYQGFQNYSISMTSFQIGQTIV